MSSHGLLWVQAPCYLLGHQEPSALAGKQQHQAVPGPSWQHSA